MTENNAKNTNAELPAFPHKDLEYDGGDQYKVIRNGLTKREYFAAMAMQGFLSRHTYTTDDGGFGTRIITPTNIAKDAVAMADALLNQLNKNNGQ